MGKIIPKDQNVRDRIATEFDKSFFVEAGAGSGKTHSLVDRMSGLITQGRAKIETIVAVTFTRKAAAELRERFQIDLEDILHDKDTPEAEKDIIAGALTNFERSSISTIHSFCARLLRERPVEAGIDPGFEEIEEADDMVFAQEVWAEYLERQGFESNELIGWMQENGIDPNALGEIYSTLVGFPDVTIFREDVKRPDFAALKKDIEKFIYFMRKKMPDKEPEAGWDTLQSTVRRCIRLFGSGYLDEDRLFVGILRMMDKEWSIKSHLTQNRWSDKDTAKDCLDDMLKFRNTKVVPALTAWQEYLHKPLIDFAMGGVDYYDKWRKERSLLNFQDLLMRTAMLLRENPEVRAYFKKQITFLLVDEFQDTDPIQAEIVMLLTGKDNSMNDWRKVKPKPGSLFLVGDPKQSIFRFRRADIDIYNQVKEIFKKGGGEVLELTANFRSLDPIRDLTNSVFKGIFPEEDSKHQAKFAELVTVRGNSGMFTSGVFENLIPDVYRNTPEAAATIDANRIANWIYQSTHGGLKLERTPEEIKDGKTLDAKAGDFMIIAKRKKMLPIYAMALEVLGIPYEISGGENFNNSEELYEIYKVLKAAADPKNPVATVAALRGTFFGASDNDLYEFARDGGRFNYFSNPVKGPKIINEAFKRLKEYNDIAQSNTPVTAIEKIIEKLGAIPLAMSEEMGSSRVGNILKAIELLRGQKPDNTGSFAELVDCLKDMRDMKGIEEMSLFPGTVKAVRIMNLHKAKGLEAPVVILGDPAATQGDFDVFKHIIRIDKAPTGYFTITRPNGEFAYEFIGKPCNWEKFAEEEKRYEEAEKRRLDYVAVTRAKNILVVSTYRKGDTIKVWESLYPYLVSMPKLSVKTEGAARKRKTFKITKKDLESEKAALEANLEKVRAESYHAGSVTSIVEKKDAFEGAGEGSMRWGSAVHEALELCAKAGRDAVEKAAPRILRDNRVPASDLAKLLKAVDSAMKSDIWKRMVAVKEKYFEVPFSGMDGDRVVMGVIDVIFKEPEGWVIVDYKTGNFEKSPKIKTAYEAQLAMYKKFWEDITGEPVKEKTLLGV